MKILIISLLLTYHASAAITESEARILAARAGQDSSFPIVVNDQVVKQLNRLLSTAKGRNHMRTCLKRLNSYQTQISTLLEKKNLPVELLAIPLVESNYQNIHSQHGWGSGLWMFVRPTALSLGLLINERVDQRLDVDLSTEAALKYLKSNHRKLRDWQLTLLSYNMGITRVVKAMKETGSRDAWILIGKGHEGDPGYLAKIMAAIIIMKNPSTLI